MNKGKNHHDWIDCGYHLVATQGFGTVNIESTARAMGKSKSSFYHYFGDWEGFEEFLLNHHITRAMAFAHEVTECKEIVPDLVHLLIDYKTDFFFHKQLRINRERPDFKTCFEKVHELFEKAVIDQWVAFLSLQDRPFLAAQTLRLISENFLLQITEEHYDFDWLKNYLQEASGLVLSMKTKP